MTTTKKTNEEQAYENNPFFDTEPASLPPVELSLAVATPPASSVQVIARNRVIHVEPPQTTWLSLVQPTSGAGYAGTFLNRKTGESFKSLEVVPIGIGTARAKMPKEFNGEGPECSSANGITSVLRQMDGSAPLYPEADCLSCPLFSRNIWAHNEGLCEPQWVITGYHPATGQVVALRLRRSNYTIGHFWNRDDVFARQVVRLHAEEPPGAKTRYYAIRAQAIYQLSNEQQEQIQTLIQQCDFIAEEAT